MEQLVNFLSTANGPFSYLIVFAILLVCGLGIPIPEDIVLFAAGLSVYYGVSQLGWMIGVTYLGVLAGDFIIFYLGTRYGLRLTQHRFFKRILSQDRLKLVQEQLDRRGNKLVFAARFMPGLRAPIYFTAGALHFPYRIFLFCDGLAALLSVPLIVGATYYFGDQIDHLIRIVHRIQWGIALVLLMIGLTVFGKWYLRRYQSKKNR